MPPQTKSEVVELNTLLNKRREEGWSIRMIKFQPSYNLSLKD